MVLESIMYYYGGYEIVLFYFYHLFYVYWHSSLKEGFLF